MIKPTRQKKIKEYKIITYLLLAVMMVECMTCFAFKSSASAGTGAKKVRIPCGVNTSLYYDEYGNLTGYCKEYLDGLADVNNWEYEYVDTTWTEAVEMLENGELDLLFPTSKTPEREETMDFSEMLGGYMVSGLFAAKDSSYAFDDFESFNGARIAITKNSSNEATMMEFAEEKGFTYVPVYINTTEDKIDALEEGTVDMVMFSTTNEVPNGKLVSVVETYPFYYSVKKGNTELLEELNDGMKQLLVDNPELMTDVIESCVAKTNGGMPAFTNDELQFIASGNEITIGFYRDTEPLAYVDSNGRYDGIYVQLIRRIEASTGLNIKLYPIDRDTYWQDLLKDNTIDFYIGASENMIAKDDDFICTSSFMDYDTVLITRNNYEVAEDEQGTIALTAARKYWSGNLPTQFKNADIIYCNTAKECLLAVKNGDADMTMLNSVVYNYQSKNGRFSELVQWENYRYKSGTVIAALSNTDPVMYAVINKSVSHIRDYEVEDIVNSYMNMTYVNNEPADYLYSIRFTIVVVAAVLIIFIIITIIVRVTYKRQSRMQKELDEHEKKQLSIMAAASFDYAGVYYVDLDTDAMTVVQIKKRYHESLTNVLRNPETFSEMIKRFVSEYVLPDYADLVIKTCDRENLINRFKTGKDFSMRYKVRENTEKQNYFEIHFVDVSENENEHVMVVGFRCIDDIISEEIAQKKVLEESNAKLVKQMRIVGSFSNLYTTTLVGDLNNDVIEKVELPEYASIIYDAAGGSLRCSMSILCRNFVDETYRKRMEKFLDADTLSKRIGANSVISQDYIAVPKGWKRANVMPMEYDASGNVIRVIIAIQQIDEEKQKELDTQEALKDAYEAANRANHAKSDFLSKMSHDMRTPLNTIIGMTTIAKMHVDDEERICDSLNKINSAGRYLLELINEVLDMSKIESGRINLIEERFNLKELTDNFVAMIRPDIDEHGHTLYVDACEIEHKYVVGDSLKIRQIFMNIMGNAIKYTPDNGIIHMSVKERQGRQHSIGCYEFVVSDNGIGMSEDFIKHIFEPFTREEDVRISKIQGTGLGMPIVRNIVHMMDGDIQIESEVGKGSTFTVTFCLKLQEKQEDDHEADADAADVLDADYSDKNVLLVEDNDLNREIAIEILEMTGMHIDSAENGKKAVDMFASSGIGHYDMILMDIQMPVMNGYEATMAIRSMDREDAKDVVIVAMTANAFVDDIRAAKDVGMNEHMSKPLDLKVIAEVFKKYLGNKDD